MSQSAPDPVMLEEERQPWERLPGESSRAYGMFTEYRLMGPGRSLAKLVQKLGKKRGYKSQLEEWSKKYDWVSRCQAYDDHEAREREEQLEKIRRSAVRSYTGHTQRMLSALDQEIRNRLYTRQGDQLVLNRSALRDLSLKDLMDYMREYILLEREVLGLNVSRFETTSRNLDVVVGEVREFEKRLNSPEAIHTINKLIMDVFETSGAEGSGKD